MELQLLILKFSYDYGNIYSHQFVGISFIIFSTKYVYTNTQEENNQRVNAYSLYLHMLCCLALWHPFDDMSACT